MLNPWSIVAGLTVAVVGLVGILFLVVFRMDSRSVYHAPPASLTAAAAMLPTGASLRLLRPKFSSIKTLSKIASAAGDELFGLLAEMKAKVDPNPSWGSVLDSGTGS